MSPVTNNILLVLAAGAPLLMVGSTAPALVLLIIARRWVLAAASVVVAVVALAGPLQFYYFGRMAAEERPHVDIRVLTANLRYGEANPEFLVNLAREQADVISVQELTEASTHWLATVGIGAQFPYSVLLPDEWAAGAGLWSRFPIEDLGVRHPEVGMISARIRVPGVQLDLVVANVHIGAPFSRPFNSWHASITKLPGILRQLADTAKSGAVIVAGDFNATPDMLDYRRLLDGGYEDAVQQSGSGFAPSFPANSWHPPVVSIDHVLLRGATSTRSHTVTVPGSDHRAVLVTAAVPIDPTASYPPG